MEPVTIVGLAFVVVGTPFIYLAIRTFARDRRIKRWPRAEGVVTRALARPSQHRVTDKNTGLWDYHTYYTPEVRYTYTLGGETFEGEHHGTSTSHKSAMKVIDKYAPQTKVSVLYNPTDPKTTYLEVRVSVGAIILLGFGTMWLVIAALVLRVALT